MTTRYRVKHAHINNLWLAPTTPKQLARNGDHLNTTSTPTRAQSYLSKEKAEALRQKWIALQLEHNRHRPKGMPKPLDPESCYIVESFKVK
jgi:hypothetical protein